ncbi:hypothetical protein B9Z55_014901 [Caenorhabditis nigoni]|uniref:Uncharacterized protein n=1 Tax=Caenorhabditis nigoni TaxID=1611254 RepID=A0A2G5U7R8_9PELO|nr:hypothetical protein B9Z55_014901 [Caenorhabditis nigoni]
MQLAEPEIFAIAVKSSDFHSWLIVCRVYGCKGSPHGEVKEENGSGEEGKKEKEEPKKEKKKELEKKKHDDDELEKADEKDVQSPSTPVRAPSLTRRQTPSRKAKTYKSLAE